MNMDILNPQLEWVDGRCYRKITQIISKENEEFESEDIYPIDPTELRRSKPKPELPEEDDDDDIQIKHDGNKFWTTFPMPSVLTKFVIGKKHATKSQIEEQTNTKISFVDHDTEPEPRNRRLQKQGKTEEEHITIVANVRLNVVQAKRRVQRILFDARWKVADFTHFISIPVNNANIQMKFMDFKKSVLTNCSKTHRITEDMFVSPSSLHLTISMLLLLNDREKEKAKELLQKQKEDIMNIVGGKTFLLEMRGLEYMNDDPCSVDVLYGKVREVDGDDCLQMIADNVDEKFGQTNFARMRPTNQRVKLHVTLIKSKSRGNGPRDSFDAHEIFEKYGDYYFGEMAVSEMHISIRYTAGDSGYYKHTYILKLQQ